MKGGNGVWAGSPTARSSLGEDLPLECAVGPGGGTFELSDKALQ